MKQIESLTIMVLVLFLCIPLHGQEGHFSLTVFAGSTVPIGRFGEQIGNEPEITRRFGFDYGEKAGLASVGPWIGAEISQSVLIENLTWVNSIKVLLNPVDNTEIQSFFQDILSDSADIVFDNGSWLNIPVFTGFSYYLGLGKDVRLYCTLQGGINLTKQPYRKAFVDGELVEEANFKFTPDFGFECGFGIEFMKKYNISIRYLNLDRPRYEGTRKLNELFFTSIPKREMNIDGDERPISMILMIFGYTL